MELSYARPALPAAVVRRRTGRLLRRPRYGQQLTYVYFEDEAGRRSSAHLPTRNGATDRGEHRQAAGAIAQGLIEPAGLDTSGANS
jgi:hypothetical protein